MPCRLLFVAVVLLLSAGRAAAQEADVLTGRVVDAAGNPIAGARVEAISVETEISRSTITNADGRYLILFPDGGGRYVLRITFIGMADVVRTVVREGQQELLITNVTMQPEAIQLEGLTVRAPLPPPTAGRAGEESTVLPQELLNRLPLPDLDPNTIALLAEGVIATELDSLSGRMGFSVAGMSDLLNQITLDGTVLRGGEMGVPEEGVRLTQVTTSTFDVSRGGFAGGLVSMTTARGANRPAGLFSYRLADDALQFNSAPTVNAFTRHSLGGSWGGPIVRNRLFYNVSFQLTRNVNHRFALAADDPLAVQRSGVSVDSIARFLSILSSQGLPVEGQTGPYDQLRDDVRLQARFDWNVMQRRSQSHTVSLRLNANVSSDDSTRISVLELAQHGGDTERNQRMAALSINSRLGTNWTNTLRVSFADRWSEALPYLQVPEGRVRVTSEFEDGTRGTRSLVFGGNRSMPSEARSRDFQIANDVSFLLPIGYQIHRLKLGGSLERSTDVQRSTADLLGVFTFASLADLEANRPERYERALAAREARMGTLNAGLYIGDTWRVSMPLELTFGLRWDRWSLDQRPAYNPAVEQAFGRRTDIAPHASALSPRIGFSYRLSEAGSPLKELSGGIGVFAGRAPTSTYASATRQTGLPDAEQRLVCIGSAVPVPDWELYLADPDAVPDTCADGGPGEPPGQAQRAPNVLLLDPAQSVPKSIRFELGYRAPLPFGLTGDIRYRYARGSGLWGYRDLNLDESKAVTLAHEGRPFFGDPAAIVPGTGAVGMATSRRFPEFGHVLELVSDRRSVAHQVTASVNGLVGEKLRLGVNYTLGFARDQGSGSFAGTPTAGNPNVPEWATSSNDRRHTLNLIVAYPFTPEIELAAVVGLSSGSPFTPMVRGDVNGDGAYNDRAFIFDPNNAPDTAIANGMARLLANVPDRVRECLTSQIGRIADRNSCRDGWTQSLSMRLGLRPNLPTIGRRLTITVDAQNVLTGLDQLLHGRNGMRGWGEGRRADATLLEVRGFDPATNAFVYEVNEGFGQVRRGPGAFRNAFSLTLSARLAVGGIPALNDRGFGPMRGGPGGFGGMRGFGGPGGFGGGPDGPRGRGEGGAGRSFNVVGLLDRMLANPIPVLLELKDTLGLSPEQVAAVEEVSARLQEKLNERREALGKRLDGMSGQEQMRAFAELQPEIEAARREVTEALAAVQKILTPEQWQRVPERVREPFRRRGPVPPRG